MTQEQILIQINLVLKAKIAELQEYILDLESRLGIVGEKETNFKLKIKELATQARKLRNEKNTTNHEPTVFMQPTIGPTPLSRSGDQLVSGNKKLRISKKHSRIIRERMPR